MGRRLGLGALSAIGLVGGLAVIGLAIVLGARPSASPGNSAIVLIARAPAGVAAEGFVLGRADAPVTIDLYEDFQCPACETWGRNVMPTLAANELAAGTAKVIFHDLAFLGPESIDAGLAAYASAQQGRFWDMWATLYANQAQENSGAFTRERLLTMAERLELDLVRFKADMDSGAARAAVDRSRADATAAGVSSTPTLIIGGRTIVGVRPYPEVAAAIAAASGR